MAVLTMTNQEFQTFPPILKEYARYTQAIKGNSEKTVCEYLLDLRTFFRYMKIKDEPVQPTESEFESISISDLTLEDIKAVREHHIIDYLVYLNLERDNSAKTRMRKISALRSLYRYLCYKRHYLDTDPTANIDAPKADKSLPKFLDYNECVRLLDAVRGDVESPTRTRDFAMIVLFLNTGMRLSELVGLNLQSISSDISTARVRGKGNKERIIYLNEFAKSALSDYLEVRLDPRYVRSGDNALFLSSREQRISNKTVQWVVHKYLGLAGLAHKGLSVHKLRHTAATLMYQSGKVDIRVLKDILGHEQLNTTQIYTHVVSRNIEEAVENNPLSNMKIKHFDN